MGLDYIFIFDLFYLLSIYILVQEKNSPQVIPRDEIKLKMHHV